MVFIPITSHTCTLHRRALFGDVLGLPSTLGLSSKRNFGSRVSYLRLAAIGLETGARDISIEWARSHFQREIIIELVDQCSIYQLGSADWCSIYQLATKCKCPNSYTCRATKPKVPKNTSYKRCRMKTTQYYKWKDQKGDKIKWCLSDFAPQ